jgi:hypothetical protein
MTEHGPLDRGVERPRSEPEIIPPGADDRARGGWSGVWIRIDERDGVRRVYLRQPGPFSIALALLAIGIIAALGLLLLAGFVLFWLPIVVAVVLIALFSGSARYHWHRLRAWWRGR